MRIIKPIVLNLYLLLLSNGGPYSKLPLMQTKNSLLLVFLSLIVLTTASCTKKGDTGAAGATGATGPAGPSYTGVISGHVDLVDQYGSKVLEGVNTAQISLNGGTAINPDVTGFYQFDNVKTGDYVIAASASGYASTVLDKFQYLADTLNKDVKMAAIPNFSFTTFTTYSNTASPAPNDSLVITFTADPRAREFIVFVNNNASVSNTVSNYLLVYTKAIPGNATKAGIDINRQDLLDAGIPSGQMAYYAVYAYVVNDVSVYEDFATGKNVYNAVNNPMVDSALVP